MAADEAGGSPLAQNKGLVFILQKTNRVNIAITHSHLAKMGSLSEKGRHHFRIDAEASFREAVKLFLHGRKAEPHADPQLNGDLHAFIFVHWVLINKKKLCPILLGNVIVNSEYLVRSSLAPA